MKLNIEALRAALAQPKTAIHCDTEEKAVALFEAMGWTRRGDYAFNTHGDRTCFHIDDTRYRPFDFWYGSRPNLSAKGYTILTLDDYILPDKPRLAEVLGVEVGQEFKFDWPGYEKSRYRIAAGGYREASVFMGWCGCAVESDLVLMINNPHLIRIMPRWTEDDIADAVAVMRVLPDNEWVARDKSGPLWGYKGKPVRQRETFMYGDTSTICYSLPRTAFPSVTWENSPVKLEEIK